MGSAIVSYACHMLVLLPIVSCSAWASAQAIAEVKGPLAAANEEDSSGGGATGEASSKIVMLQVRGP